MLLNPIPSWYLSGKGQHTGRVSGLSLLSLSTIAVIVEICIMGWDAIILAIE